jgi:outer membrane biosynthesis protein TonB
MCTYRFLVALAAASIAIRAFALEPDQIYAKVAPSIVVVFGYHSSAPDDISFGSGVIVAPGQIVTNCHVVEGADVIYLLRATVKTLGIVRYADPDRDLCQISAANIKGFEHAVSYMPRTDALRVGQKVYAIGAPQGLELTLSDGLISSLRMLPIGTIIQTNAPVSKGSSGGGLFDSSGRLIGITSFIFKSGQNLNFAVPASWISELAARHKAREETERREEQKRAELEKRQLEEEQRKAAAEQRREEAEQKRAEAEQKRAEQEKLWREDETHRAEEQKRLEDQRRVVEPKRDEERKPRAAAVERERQQQEAVRKQREAEETKRRAEAAVRAAQQKLIDDWRARIQTKIKSRVVMPPNMEGNPQALFEVVLLPGGEILTATLRKSSGNPAYDAAVERAIMAAQPLPVPTETDLFQEYFQELTLVFRPRD